MRVFVDLDTSKLILLPGVASEVASLRFKRAPAANLEVQFTRAGVVVELESGAAGVFGIKTTGEYDADFVTAGLAWVKSGTGESAVYSFNISFITGPLDTLFHVNEDEEDDVAQLTLMGELKWEVGGATFKTPTLEILVDNDVIRGDETLPEMPAIAYAVFLNGITELTGGTIGESPITHLDAIPTAGLLTGYIVEVLVEVDDVLSWLTFRLVEGASLEMPPGEVGPLDYDAGTNDRHWEGAVGPAGVAGATWRTGAGVPSDAVGVNGDLYLNTANGDVYQRASGSYGLIANIKGPVGATGATGPAGSVWRTGSTAPAGDLGVNGDYYLRTSNGDVYLRASGSYSVVGNIRGLAGANGATWRSGVGIPSDSLGVKGDFYLRTTTGDVYYSAIGTGIYGIVANIKGDPGPVGPGILSGSGVPSAGLGEDGEFYIDTTAWEIYGPKAAGAWGSATALATGPAGTAGAAQAAVAVTGTQNGSNKVFALAQVIPAGAEQIYLNGQLLTPGSGNDYVIAGTALTFQAAISAPLSTDVIRAYGTTGVSSRLTPAPLVANLSGTPTQGDVALVTDALTPAFLVPVVGGGAVVTPVFYDGSDWVAF